VPATSMCHTRAPMQHQEKQSNGIFSLPHTSHSASLQSGQSIALMVSISSSSTPVSSTRNGLGGSYNKRCTSSAHPASLFLQPPEPISLVPCYLGHTAIVVNREKIESLWTARPLSIWIIISKTGNFGEASSLRPAHSLFILWRPAHDHPKE
jgi:hypothetical protein